MHHFTTNAAAFLGSTWGLGGGYSPREALFGYSLIHPNPHVTSTHVDYDELKCRQTSPELIALGFFGKLEKSSSYKCGFSNFEMQSKIFSDPGLH
jgi:hypothetical protein